MDVFQVIKLNNRYQLNWVNHSFLVKNKLALLELYSK